MKYVGIDLGTTYSCISVLDEMGRDPKVINVYGKSTTPSVVYFKDGTVVVGASAKSRRKLRPEKVVEFAKRNMIKPGFQYNIDGAIYTPVDISSFILKELFDSFRKEYPTDDFICTVTCPAGYDPKIRGFVKDAAVKAGIVTEEEKDTKLKLVNEPTAAAISYCESEKFEKGGLMIFDLGGGTLDITVLYRDENGKYEVLASEGKDELGGMDWDEEVEKEIFHQLSESTERSVEDLKSDVNTRNDANTLAEDIKKDLSTMDYEDEIEVGDDNINFTFSQSEFEKKTETLLNSALTLIETVRNLAVAQAKERKIPDFTIGKLILVGGSCYMPQISKGILERYPEFTGKIAMHEPDLAISKGAAFYSRMSGSPDKVVKEILSRTFGVEVEDRNNPSYHYCDNLLFKNDTIPNFKDGTYYIYPPYRYISIKVLMNYCRDKDTQKTEEIKNCTVLNEFILELPEPPKERESVYVKFEVSVEGILTVTAKCQNVSNHCEVRIKDMDATPTRD